MAERENVVTQLALFDSPRRTPVPSLDDLWTALFQATAALAWLGVFPLRNAAAGYRDGLLGNERSLLWHARRLRGSGDPAADVLELRRLVRAWRLRDGTRATTVELLEQVETLQAPPTDRVAAFNEELVRRGPGWRRAHCMPLAPYHTPRFDIVLETGERLEGVTVHGAGGRVRDERKLHLSALKAEFGLPLGVVEPRPGHLQIFVGETVLDGGEPRVVPAKGATFRLLCCGEKASESC